MNTAFTWSVYAICVYYTITFPQPTRGAGQTAFHPKPNRAAAVLSGITLAQRSLRAEVQRFRHVRRMWHSEMFERPIPWFLPRFLTTESCSVYRVKPSVAADPILWAFFERPVGMHEER